MKLQPLFTLKRKGMIMKYKVLTAFSYGFDDVWQLDEKPHRFNSIKDAEKEISDHMATTKEQMKYTMDRIDFKIVEADTDPAVFDYIVGCKQ